MLLAVFNQVEITDSGYLATYSDLGLSIPPLLQIGWLKLLFLFFNFIYGFQKDQTVPLYTASCLDTVS